MGARAHAKRQVAACSRPPCLSGVASAGRRSFVYSRPWDVTGPLCTLDLVSDECVDELGNEDTVRSFVPGLCYRVSGSVSDLASLD